MKDALYNDMVSRKWFLRRADKVRQTWTVIGILALSAGIALTIVLAYFTKLGLLGIPLVIGALLLLIGAKRMPARTAKGTAMTRRVDGFRIVIEKAEEHMSKWAEQENVFTRFLPFAVVFGVTDKWAKAFESLGQLPSDTTWYVSSRPFVYAHFAGGVDFVRGDDERHDRVDTGGLGLERLQQQEDPAAAAAVGAEAPGRVAAEGPAIDHGARTAMDIVFSQDPRDLTGVTGRRWSGPIPAGTFFHTPGFLKLYWEEFADQPDHLLLAFADEDGEQVGAVAFGGGLDGTLRFLGGTEVTDYMGPVALPDARSTVAKELFAALGRTGDWTEADLRGLPKESPWLELLAEAAAAQGFSTEVLEDQNGVAPFLPLPGSYEEFLERLPSKLRHEIKRKARRLEAEVGPWHICLATQDTLEAFLDRFVELHRTSEGPKGVFMQPGMEIFFPQAGRGVPPARRVRSHVHRDGRAREARRVDRVPVRGHLFAVQLRVRPRVRGRVTRDGARRRRHPHRHRGGLFRVRHAEGRLRVQVSIRGDA